MHHAPFYTNIIQHIFKNMYLKHVNMFKKLNKILENLKNIEHNKILFLVNS